jgi:DNA invertase Pin-like site-specific DNA recombinase
MKNIRCAAYLRQSLDRDGNELAVDRQRTECANLASRKGWGKPTFYVDNDTSATNGKPRPAYNDMLADIEAGAIDAVVTYHLDRLHRQPIELEHFIALADRRAVKLATCTGDVDLATDNGRLIARITGAVAKAEVERKSRRQKDANKQRAEKGKPWVARVFGYDGDEIVWDEAEAIREGCNALLEGRTLWSIAVQWNSRGIKTVKGCQWNGSTVRQVLVRPRNAGLAVYDVHGKGNQGAILDGVQTSWPAIVERDTFDAVAALLADPDRHTGKRRARVHLLSGLAVCGLCGNKLGTISKPTKKKGTKRAVYQCKTMGCMKIVRSQPNVDRVVIKAVTGRLARPDAAKIFERPAVDTRALRKRASELDTLIKAAQADYDNGLVDATRMNSRIAKLQPEFDAITAQLVGANTSRKLEGLLGNPDAAEAFAKLSLDRRRAVIDTCATVTVMPNERRGGAFDAEKVVIDWHKPE